MKNNELEKYISELSPEMQEKARQCKTKEELNAMLAENDVELSEDALSAVAGGCSASGSYYKQGDLVTEDSIALCPACGSLLYYWDVCAYEKGCSYITRMYCKNSSCSSYNNGLWYSPGDPSGNGIIKGNKIEKY